MAGRFKQERTYVSLSPIACTTCSGEAERSIGITEATEQSAKTTRYTKYTCDGKKYCRNISISIPNALKSTAISQRNKICARIV
jgi:hypothetical protein